MNLPVAAILFCLYALLVACVEIEIEGAYGWAERLPTWYRVSGPLARLYRGSGGRPLTGYHLFMVPALLLSFHLGFAFGLRWSLTEELRLLAVWAAWVPLWDFIWFLFNPAYGLRRFRPGLIWWHRSWLGPVPRDYVVGVGGSLLLAAAVAVAADRAVIVVDQLVLLAAFAVFTVLCALAAPFYQSWYRRTHSADFDERERVEITPPPDERPSEPSDG